MAVTLLQNIFGKVKRKGHHPPHLSGKKGCKSNRFFYLAELLALHFDCMCDWAYQQLKKFMFVLHTPKTSSDFYLGPRCFVQIPLNRIMGVWASCRVHRYRILCKIRSGSMEKTIDLNSSGSRRTSFRRTNWTRFRFPKVPIAGWKGWLVIGQGPGGSGVRWWPEVIK